MHTQTLYTYALVALASSVLAAPVGTPASASASISKNLVAREPFVVYGKSFEEEDGGGFGMEREMVAERVRRVDGWVFLFCVFVCFLSAYMYICSKTMNRDKKRGI